MRTIRWPIATVADRWRRQRHDFRTIVKRPSSASARPTEIPQVRVSGGRPIPGLIIAATAELHGAEVLHVNSDYDLIAEVTGQPMRRLLDPGHA